MSKRHVLMIGVLVLASVVILSATWEFLLEPVASILFDVGHDDEDTAEHWEYVLTSSAFAALALIVPMILMARSFEAQQRAQLRLRESESHLATAQRIAQLGSWDWRASDNRITWSAEVYRLLGRDPALPPYTFREFLELVHPADEPLVRSTWKAAVAGQAGFEVEFRLAPPDGEWRNFRVVGQAFHGVGGQVISLSGTLQDLTDRVREQEQLQQARRMEVVGKLTGGVAHDFNNMLMVVQGNTELIQTFSNDENIQKFADTVLHATRRGSELTQRLLAYSRRQILHPEVTDLNQVLSELAGMLHPTLGEAITIELQLTDGLRPCFVDPGQLENAFLNLALNARDAMPGGGKLIVSSSQLDAEGDEHIPDGSYVCLTVADTGTGMPEDVLNQAAEPFFTTKGVGKGSGLGLSMAEGFARQSGGQLTIHSEPGQGTVVDLFLPVASLEQLQGTKEQDSVTAAKL